jgi:hypothetical protein
LTPLGTPKERASLLGVYSRNQLCGILVAFFSYSKEPVGDRMLNVTLNKHELARIASEVLIIDEATHIHCLHIRNYLTTDELTRYVKSRAASGDLVIQHRELFEAYRDNERYTTRAFWNKKAHGAARRQLATDHPPQEKVDELTWLFEEIFRQQDGECLYCCAPLRISKGKAWNNASPDRRVSAKKGGEYTKGNIDILCVGFQFCKWWYKPSEFRVLLLAKADAQWYVKEGVLSSSKRSLRVLLSQSDLENLVGPWCKKMISAMQERKECEMTFDDVMTLLQDSWMGNGLLVDEAGVIAPLETFSIDRLDSSIGYKNGNARLLLWGLNNLKGDDKDDLTVIKYLQHLRTSQGRIQIEIKKLQKHEIRLPLQP